jgi:hypothetical protein
MFPTTAFRQAYDQIQGEDPRHASRRYLKILEWAATNSESSMEQSLRALMDAGDELDFDRLVRMSERPVEKPFDIHIPLPDMHAYDALIEEVAV